MLVGWWEGEGLRVAGCWLFAQISPSFKGLPLRIYVFLFSYRTAFLPREHSTLQQHLLCTLSCLTESASRPGTSMYGTGEYATQLTDKQKIGPPVIEVPLLYLGGTIQT